jgi:hypothetical protein
MKRIFTFVLAAIFAISFSVIGFAQESKPAAGEQPAAAEKETKEEKPAEEAAPAPAK